MTSALSTVVRTAWTIIRFFYHFAIDKKKKQKQINQFDGHVWMIVRKFIHKIISILEHVQLSLFTSLSLHYLLLPNSQNRWTISNNDCLFTCCPCIVRQFFGNHQSRSDDIIGCRLDLLARCENCWKLTSICYTSDKLLAIYIYVYVKCQPLLSVHDSMSHRQMKNEKWKDKNKTRKTKPRWSAWLSDDINTKYIMYNCIIMNDK